MNKQEQKLETFEECCEFLGITNELPACQLDEREIQAVYKLKTCMTAWNKLDNFETNKMAWWCKEKEGYVPHFIFSNGKLMSSGRAHLSSNVGIIIASENMNTEYSVSNKVANFGLRLSLSSLYRAVQFGQTYIQLFNELILVDDDNKDKKSSMLESLIRFRYI